MADQDLNILVDRIRESSQYFSSLVELIPAKFYEKDTSNNEYQNSKKQKIPQSGKATRDLKKQLAKRAKYLKLDPGQHKTVKEIQEMIEEREKALLEESMSEAEDHAPAPFIDRHKSSSVDELRSKLHSKLDAFQAQRKTGKDRKDTKVAKAKKGKRGKKPEKVVRSSKNFDGKGVSKNTTNSEKSDVKSSRENETKGEMIFGNLVVGDNERKSKKRKQSDKRLLQKALAKKQKLEIIEKEDKSKATEIKSADIWKRALKHAEGVKVKDDAKLLNKSIKKKQKQKEKSAKKWKERVENQNKQMQEKQKVRREHLKERKDNKKKGKNKKR